MNTSFNSLRFIFMGLLFFGAFTFVNAQDLSLEGQVSDHNSGEQLAFSTINIQGTAIGTVSNLKGQFKLNIPQEHTQGNLVVSFIGYETQIIKISTSTTLLNITLQPAIQELGEVVVRPISPEDYIRQAMAKRKENYGNEFQANAYFRQLTKDNGAPFQLADGYCQTYSPSFLDTVELQQRLVLFAKNEDLDDLKFGQRKAGKKLKKAKKKAEKSGQEFDEEQAKEDSRAVVIDMLSPTDVIDLDPIRNLEGYLNPEKLDQYTYHFKENTTFQGRDMIVIQFESRRKAKASENFPKGKQDRDAGAY